MTTDEQQTKQRLWALRQYMLTFNAQFVTDAMDDGDVIAAFHTVLYRDMTLVSAALAWEEPPMPDEVGN